MLSTVKMALQITTDAFDSYLTELIDAALNDLALAGVQTDGGGSLITIAVCTYVRARFGSPADYDQIKAAYDEQKAQLMTATGYTDWGESE